MSWAKLDDRFPDHPKVVRAGGDAAWLHVCALCYVAGQLTDGFIPASVVPRLSDRKNPAALAEKLIEVGLWDRIDGGYQIHDYLDWNPSADEVRRKRAEKSQAGKAGAAKRWQTDSRSNGSSHSTSDGSTHSSSHDVRIAAGMPPSRPVLSRPDPTPTPLDPPLRLVASPPTSTTNRTKGTRLPEEWKPDESAYDWASTTLGFDRRRVDDQADRFRDYWRAKPGRAGVKLDWGACFRNWLRQAKDWDRPGKQPDVQRDGYDPEASERNSAFILAQRQKAGRP